LGVPGLALGVGHGTQALGCQAGQGILQLAGVDARQRLPLAHPLSLARAHFQDDAAELGGNGDFVGALDQGQSREAPGGTAAHHRRREHGPGGSLGWGKGGQLLLALVAQHEATGRQRGEQEQAEEVGEVFLHGQIWTRCSLIGLSGARSPAAGRLAPGARQ
jgi:hypothetical protein